MSKHTPGPWTQDKYGDVTDASGQTIRVEGVALTGRSTEESRANARLIAAAPELLEALQAMVKEFGFDVVHPQGLVHDEPHAIRSAIKAIAKATDV
jgi:hypothetical protein